MSITASAHSINGTLRHETDVNGRHTIITDEPERLGGTDTAPAPHELLPAMLASCVSTMIVLYARSRNWQLEDLRVDVDYDTDSTPRRVALTIHLPDGLTPDQVQRLRRVADTCPVRRAFEAGFAFDEELLADLPATEIVASATRGRRPSTRASSDTARTTCSSPRPAIGAVAERGPITPRKRRPQRPVG
jgi:putative redox protein